MTTTSAKKPSITLRFVVMLLAIGALLGGLVYFNWFKARMIHQFMEGQAEPPVTVTAALATRQDWTVGVDAIGTLRALRAVDLSPEVAGIIRTVGFRSGAHVRARQVLIEMNDEAERATLRSLESARELARLTLQRDRQLLAIQAVTAAQVETDEADLQVKIAQVEAQRALIDKKTLVAPFEGKLGIATVAPGQYVNPGDKLANLQDVERMLIDFSIPQNQAGLARMNVAVDLTVDAFPGEVFHGVVSARNAAVDAATRNLQVEATVANARHRLLPGMFAHVSLLAKGTARYQTLPLTAVAFNPYGAVVYLVKEGTGKDGKKVLTAQQTIVTTGPTRGDQVAVLSGVPDGAQVVTSGQLKLRNGTPVVIDNQVTPSTDADPHPSNR